VNGTFHLSVALAATELPLLQRSASVAGLPALDTTELDVQAIVGRLSEGVRPPAG
jgi:hypothetical protein